jgi:benzoyl-CoA reductase/2-hydroxyglutaryl-CoA dehydratase subunit BcrC/BadD/HgdB
MLGWVCSYTPEEIFMAMGIRSCRLYGGDHQATAMQNLLPVNLCPLVRACLCEGLEGAGTGASLSGVVSTTSCHALVHLANAFQHARGGSGRFFVYLLDLPRTLDRENEAACLAFAASLRDMAGRLSEFYEVAWDDNALRTAIAIQQQVRLLLQEIYRMRQERPEQFRAAGLLELVRHAGCTPKEELAALLRSLVASLRDQPLEAIPQVVYNRGFNASQPGSRGVVATQAPTGAPPEAGERMRSSGVNRRTGQDDEHVPSTYLERLRRQGPPRGPRLLITGSPLPPAYLDLIEELGGNVAGDDLCQGYRYCLHSVDAGLDGDGGDLFLGLARSYLQRPPCPRMLAGQTRFAYLQALIRECRAQGVVYHALKFCDASLYDYTLLRSRCVEAGIPLLFLETEYRDAGLEQARTRIQAFLELLPENLSSGVHLDADLPASTSR